MGGSRRGTQTETQMLRFRSWPARTEMARAERLRAGTETIHGIYATILNLWESFPNSGRKEKSFT